MSFRVIPGRESRSLACFQHTSRRLFTALLEEPSSMLANIQRSIPNAVLQPAIFAMLAQNGDDVDIRQK